MTLLARLVEASERVSAASARLTKVRELAQFLRTLEPSELAIGVLYLSGEVPQGRCGIGPTALRAADAAAAASRPSLSLAEVDRTLAEVAVLCGKGVAARRAAALGELFQRATVPERLFLARLLLGELRQGALAGVMVDAIALAADVPVSEVRRAMMYAPDIGAVAQAALNEECLGFASFQLEVLAPIAPMLAQTATDPGQALRELGGEAAFEWKVDGARIQVHKSGPAVRIYTRNLNDVTAALPEIVDQVQALPAAELILDGEAVALDTADRPHPFQVTMRRFGRKLDVARLTVELPMRAFFFDCLRSGHETLADRPTRERFAALDAALPGSLRMPRLVTTSEAEAQTFYESALAAGHEGVMAKSLDAPYEAGSRGAAWLKIKRAHTLDLVILAAEWGHGRRTGKLSNLHLGALDPATGEYVMLGKTFKGLTDRMLEWQTKELLARETGRDPMTVYVRPELVAEIAFSDLQASPRYPGGLALRLARVKRYRTDKGAAHADTMETVRRIYDAQRAAATPTRP
ncbi:MAG TPA: ATP-dependent DNA ligase [Steroidobacteraceae bacterium]|nr:ATP-dependent DNA ligase [Steroidobacteraceae bacterium]